MSLTMMELSESCSWLEASSSFLFCMSEMDFREPSRLVEGVLM